VGISNVRPLFDGSGGLLIDGQVVVGFDRGKLERLLGLA
jgi:hypothetical protein